MILRELKYIHHIQHIQQMVKTIRISDENHKELLKIQGELQSESGEFTSMDDAIAEMVEVYKKKHK